MNQTTFWSIVESSGWGTKTQDHKKLQKELLKKLTKREAEHVREIFEQLKSKLYDKVTNWEEETENSVGLGDDSFDDLLSHIVGLGKQEYEATMMDPQRAYERARKRLFKRVLCVCPPVSRGLQRRITVILKHSQSPRKRKHARTKSIPRRTARVSLNLVFHANSTGIKGKTRSLKGERVFRFIRTTLLSG
jgi:hypothetical protein